jgi:hypothetical protein
MSAAMQKLVDLWYPNVDLEKQRTEDEPTEIVVGLMHVRAASDITIDFDFDFDFDRNGYRIRMRRYGTEPASEDDCPLEEVAFIPAYLEPLSPSEPESKTP